MFECKLKVHKQARPRGSDRSEPQLWKRHSAYDSADSLLANRHGLRCAF